MVVAKGINRSLWSANARIGPAELNAQVSLTWLYERYFTRRSAGRQHHTSAVPHHHRN
jgi:hypothetical protein